jgi:hypothetical protein
MIQTASLPPTWRHSSPRSPGPKVGIPAATGPQPAHRPQLLHPSPAPLALEPSPSPGPSSICIRTVGPFDSHILSVRRAGGEWPGLEVHVSSGERWETLSLLFVTEEGGYGWPREARQRLRRRDGVGRGEGKGGEGVGRGGVGQARVSRVEERAGLGRSTN